MLIENTFNTNLVEAWLSWRVLHQQGKGEVCLCCCGYWLYKVWSPYVSHMLPRCSEVLTFNARMTTSVHMCFPYVEALPLCWFVFRHLLPYVRQHMGRIQFGCFWKHSACGLHMGRIWAAHMQPICGQYVSAAVVIIDSLLEREKWRERKSLRERVFFLFFLHALNF